MSYSRSTSVVSRVFDAVLRPESSPLALEAVAETVGAIGSAYIVRSKETARVTVPDAQSVSASDLADCFGLSPAESRLALMTGKKQADIAVVFGVQITTLRTQLSSILRKASVKRQIDLLRVLPTVTNLQET
jgi:DNA-binding CsgD family transcriptional regulator